MCKNTFTKVVSTSLVDYPTSDYQYFATVPKSTLKTTELFLESDETQCSYLLISSFCWEILT